MVWVLLLSFVVSENQMAFTQIEFKDEISCHMAEETILSGSSSISTTCQPKE